MKKTIIWSAAALLLLTAPGRLGAEGGIGLGVDHHGLYQSPVQSWESTYENPFHDYVLPLMMDLPSVVDQYLHYQKELGLTPEQQKSLKDMRGEYQARIVQLDSDLNVELMNLHDLMMEDDVDLMLIQSEDQRVEDLQSQIRTRNIGLFYAARKILTEEQRKEAGKLGIKQSPYEYYGYHWATDF